MKSVVFSLLLLGAAGCSRPAEMTLSSTVSFSAQGNRGLTATVVSLNAVDKMMVIEGSASSPFDITVGVSATQGPCLSSRSAVEMLFEYKDGVLSLLNMGGAGEGPAIHRENDREITVYYPTELGNQRSWVKFVVNFKPCPPGEAGKRGQERPQGTGCRIGSSEASISRATPARRPPPA